MTEDEKTTIINWILTKGNPPDEKRDIYPINDIPTNSTLLPCGKFNLSVSDKEKIILDKWINDSSKLHEKSIYLNDHYAFAAHSFNEDGTVSFIGTFRE